MAKAGREKIKLESTAGTGHFYTTTKNKRTTPEKIVTHLNEVITKALRSEEMTQRLAKLGGESAPCTPAEFKALIESELKKYAEIVKTSGARVD